jgi:sodium ion-translocating decarboxylase beta subunit
MGNIDWSMLFAGLTHIGWQNIVMIGVSCLLLWVAVAKGAEPLLIIPIAFGILLANIPLSRMAATDQGGVLNLLYNAGILTEILPSLIFVGLGAMMDWGPMLANPNLLIFGAAGQIGIFLTLLLCLAVGFTKQQSAAISIIGACDGPTAIYFGSLYARDMLPAISIAAYSYMSLVPIIQPPIIRAMTTKKERAVLMSTSPAKKVVSKRTRILFPLVAGIFGMLIAPFGAPLWGMFMFGNFLRECGVVDRLTNVAEGAMVDIVTLLLGITVGCSLLAGNFMTKNTMLVLLFGIIAISLDTVGGVALGKIAYVFTHGKFNPMIGAAGTSAFPMSSRVVQKEGQRANVRSFLLWHAVGANTGGQCASVIAASVMLAILAALGIKPM